MTDKRVEAAWTAFEAAEENYETDDVCMAEALAAADAADDCVRVPREVLVRWAFECDSDTAYDAGTAEEISRYLNG
jgi:hypothetical protein